MSNRRLALVLLLMPWPAAHAGDWAEPNPSCPTAYALGTGTFTGLDVFASVNLDCCYVGMGCCSTWDEDWFRISIPPSSRLELYGARTDAPPPAGGSLSIQVYTAQSGCSNLVWCGGIANAGSVSVPNPSTTPLEVVVTIRAFITGEGMVTIPYLLDVAHLPLGCAGTADWLDPSSVTAPRRLTPVTLTSLVAGATGLPGPEAWDDVYAVRVPPGATLDARISFSHASGNLDLLLTRSGTGIVLASSTTTADVEQASVTNATALVEEYGVAVNALGNGTCNTYQLEIAVNDPSIGTSYCISAPNSTQNGASLRAFGSASLGSPNTLDFVVEGLPSGVPCLLYYGSGTTQVPFGDGYRCVAGATFREALVFADAIGEAVVPFDAAHNQPAGVVLPGSTWNFQAYYRNVNGPLGNGFNLSDGYTITFLP